MVQLSDEEFEAAVEAAIDSIPDQFVDALENVVFMVADEPKYWQLESGQGTYAQDAQSDLLGLYDGVSLGERDTSYGAFDEMPDTITIFKGPHERLEGTRAEVLEEVRKTVIHEVGHYFGMDEDQLDAMGYGAV